MQNTILEFPRSSKELLVEYGQEGWEARAEDMYRRAGIAVIVHPSERSIPEAISLCAEGLGLGEPFVPELYRSEKSSSLQGISVLSSENQSTNNAAFRSTGGQDMHADATLEPMGKVPTTLLHCSAQAVEGGDTIFYNSTGCFSVLRSEDPEAAEVLTRQHVLRRISSYDAGISHTDGPAFHIDPDTGAVTSRFSISKTDFWNFRGAEEASLGARALSRLLEMAAREEFQLRLHAAPGQTILFANDKLSHSRDPFTDNPALPRKMGRALFLVRPHVLATSSRSQIA